MKKWLAGAAAFLMISGLTPAKDTHADRLPFKDIPQDHRFWAEEEIGYLINEGIISGYSDGTFRPNDTLTRQQASGLIVQALDLNLAGRPDPNFKDIKKGAYYYKAIAAVAEEGLIRGSNGNFRPNESITRAQMAAILRRAFAYKPVNVQKFIDIEKTHWAYLDINSISENGITWGKGKLQYDQMVHYFVPGEATTRAQFSVFLARALNSDLSIASGLGSINGNHTENKFPNLGDWEIKVDKTSVTAQNKKTGEEDIIVDEGQLFNWYRHDLRNRMKDSSTLTVELDASTAKLSSQNYLQMPVILKGGSLPKPIRSYLSIEISADALGTETEKPVINYRLDPFNDYSLSKYNQHQIIMDRFVGNVKKADSNNVTISIYRGRYYDNQLFKLFDVLIKNDRTSTGYKDPEYKDFTSIRADGSRYFYYNTNGLYSMYHDGTQKKLLLKGNIHSFKIDGTTIYAELENGAKYKMSYTGTSLQKVN
ncbi:S-layer homology domain-containing protein [Cytobacillus massiliigabonensis]|uniref:S-layer homology domain-containing protein n=1 Tax=Cytobacillus massiliigabonensis TaxID=1871011 RepID=UPI000C835265|nr:S-layer homology domain-containing protein [Cytobacillus massiliigabonensis]